MKAFPSSTQNKVWEDGMELRDYFAAKAMQLYVGEGNTDKESVARWSYEIADAMMKAREQ
jgi:hypothetical protein